MSFASFIRPPPTLPRYTTPQGLYLDIPARAALLPTVHYPQPVRPVYRLPLQPLANNTLPHRHQSYRPTKMADQDFKMDFMFDDYFDDPTNMLNTSKQSVTLPMCPHALPSTYSFRPWFPPNHNTPTTAPQDTMLPGEIEGTPDVPTPAVLSTSVDVFKYENVQEREWLEGRPEYTGISPASADTFDGSPRSEYIETFDGNLGGYSFNSWAHSHPNGMQAGRLQSIASSVTDGSSASPALSYEEFNHSAGPMSWSTSTSMFGQPDVVPPSRFHRPNQYLQPVLAPPQEIERPMSQQSDSSVSVVPTMNLRQGTVEDEAYAKRRDKMLIDMRNKGHSYKDIKRAGHFKEAESTLRGRLRTLTKEKSERVRKPKWNGRDVWQNYHDARSTR